MLAHSHRVLSIHRFRNQSSVISDQYKCLIQCWPPLVVDSSGVGNSGVVYTRVTHEVWKSLREVMSLPWPMQHTHDACKRGVIKNCCLEISFFYALILGFTKDIWNNTVINIRRTFQWQTTFNKCSPFTLKSLI